MKQALTLLVLVVLVFSAFSIVEPLLTAVDGRLQPSAIALLLALWAGTALLFPACRRAVARFVDRVVLRRADYGSLLQRLSDDVQQCDSPDAVLDRGCDVVATSLTATSVKWETRTLHRSGDLASREIAIWTAEPPHYVLVIGQLAGGRRLLSDDLAMLERVAFVLARRIDALRLTEERYERMLQEREMRTLATEAELRALRAQINPHFLFNALTTIGYLIQQAPSRALKTLLDLTTLAPERAAIGRRVHHTRARARADRLLPADRTRAVRGAPRIHAGDSGGTVPARRAVAHRPAARRKRRQARDCRCPSRRNGDGDRDSGRRPSDCRQEHWGSSRNATEQ